MKKNHLPREAMSVTKASPLARSLTPEDREMFKGGLGLTGAVLVLVLQFQFR